MSSAAVVIGALKANCQYFSQLTIHGKNMTSVYKKMAQSVLPREYLPDDYAGPSAGSVKQIVGKIIFNDIFLLSKDKPVPNCCRFPNSCCSRTRYRFLAHRIRISACFTCTDNSFLAYRIRISACFIWTDNSYLTHVISPRT